MLLRSHDDLRMATLTMLRKHHNEDQIQVKQLSKISYKFGGSHNDTMRGFSSDMYELSRFYHTIEHGDDR